MNCVAAVLPLASPGQMMAQAAESTDRIAQLIQQALSGEKKRLAFNRLALAGKVWARHLQPGQRDTVS